jgi:hypothetical protein
VAEEVRQVPEYTRQSAITRTHLKAGEFGITDFTEAGASKTKKFYIDKLGYEFIRWRLDEETGMYVTVYKDLASHTKKA